MTEIDPIEAENALLAHYQDEVLKGHGGFFTHIGLGPRPSWGEFRRHYDKAGLPDIERVANDFSSYPPNAEAIAKLQAESGKNIISLKDWISRKRPSDD